MFPDFNLSRRQLLRGGLAFGALAFMTPEAFAAELMKTPRLTEGPFYPDKLPLDTDNDLIIIGKSTTPAIGEVTHLTGRILDTSGSPTKDATIEIWQCDANAVYIHTRDSGPKEKQRDKNFQGYGRFETDSQGGYRFRTIKPVPYPGRPAPHIHFKVSKNGHEVLTSQIFIDSHPGNARDGVFADLRDPIDRELCMTEFKKIKDSKIGELSASLDIVVGRTSDENPERKRPQKK
jgi:protocatechuate 3,4-dioxygenase, beta subunit